MKRLFGFAILTVTLGIALTAHAQVDPDMMSESENSSRCATDSKYMMDATTKRMNAEEALSSLQQQASTTNDRSMNSRLVQAQDDLKRAQNDEKSLMDEMAVVCKE